MEFFFVSRLINYLKSNWIQIILIILSIYDLRIDLKLLIDFFTFSSFFYMISDHPLAITVLITIPTLFKSVKYNQ